MPCFFCRSAVTTEVGIGESIIRYYRKAGPRLNTLAVVNPGINLAREQSDDPKEEEEDNGAVQRTRFVIGPYPAIHGLESISRLVWRGAKIALGSVGSVLG